MTETIPWLVQIWQKDIAGEWHFNGNGVLVDKKSVLTCKHVITAKDEPVSLPPEDLMVRLGNGLTATTVRDVEPSDSEDLALLRLDQMVRAALPDFCIDVQKTDVLGVRAWQERGKAIELQAGESIQCTEVVRDRLWYFDHGIPGGFSGSPLLLDSKRRSTIVGVIEQGGKEKSKSAVIPPSLVCEFLEDHDVPIRKKARWFWLARNILVSAAVLLCALGFLLDQTLGKNGLLIAACVCGVVLGASVWVGAATQKGERTSDHLLYPFLRWLDQRKFTLIFVAAISTMAAPTLIGWWTLAHQPKAVINNIALAAQNTTHWVRKKFNSRTAPAVEVVRAIPASTELDVALVGGLGAGSVSAAANYGGRVVNDVVVPGGQGAIVPKGTPVILHAIPSGSSMRFELVKISLNGNSFNTSTSPATNPETGEVVEVPLKKTVSLASGGDHAQIGGAVGWLSGLAFGHKGKRVQTATQMSSVGAQIGSRIASDGSKIQTVHSIPAGQVLAFRLSEPIDLKP